MYPKYTKSAKLSYYNEFIRRCCNVIIFYDSYLYHRRKSKKQNYTEDEVKRMMENKYKELVERLKNTPMGKCTPEKAELLADEVLELGGYKNIVGATPIVKIAQMFGFKTIALTKMMENTSGNIFIGGTTEDIYKAKKVIIVGYNEVLFHQRFIIAHELAHYLIDYLGSAVSKTPNILFQRAYTKTHHDSDEEIRADRFAAEILMPRDAFRKQYYGAMEESVFDEVYTISFLSYYFRTKESSIRRRIQEIIVDITE